MKQVCILSTRLLTVEVIVELLDLLCNDQKLKQSISNFKAKCVNVRGPSFPEKGIAKLIDLCNHKSVDLSQYTGFYNREVWNIVMDWASADGQSTSKSLQAWVS